MFTISDNQVVRVAGLISLHVQRQEIKFYDGIWSPNEPGTLLVRRIVFRPSRGKEETRRISN